MKERKIRKKKTFFAAVILDHFWAKMFKSEATPFHYLSPRIPNLYFFGHKTLWGGGQKTIKRYLKSELTDTPTNTYRKHWPRGPMLWKSPCFAKIAKKGIFEGFLDFCQDSTLQSAEVFCVAFSASGRLFCAIKIHYRTIFPFFNHRGDPYDLGWSKCTLPTKNGQNQKN